MTEIQILVAWSPCASHAHQLLRASLVLRDRSITLYEEVHLETHIGQQKIHKQFLKKCKVIIPLHCQQVLVITDAGFRTDWFQQVIDMGWNFEGRVRGNMHYSADNGDSWQACTSLYKTATSKSKYIGKVYLSKTKQLVCAMYLYKEKNTQKKNAPKKSKGKIYESYRQSHYDPWLLVTSVTHKKLQATKVVNQYKRRMKIAPQGVFSCFAFTLNMNFVILKILNGE